MRPESSQPAAPARARPVAFARGGARLVVALAVCGALWLLWQLSGFDYGLDQGIYDAVARVMHAGGVPYRDAWDFKPPGIFFAYAAARSLFGEGMRAVRLLEALGFASLLPAFALLSRRFTGGLAPGLLGFALAASGHVWLGFWHTAQPESFGAVLLAWALVLATAPAGTGDARARRRRALAWAGSGALYALAALMKPPLGGGLLVSFGFAVRAARRAADPLPAWRLPALCFVAGALVPPLLALLYFAAAGALPDLVEALFVFAPEYTRINYRSGGGAGFALRSLLLLFARFSLLNPLGLVLLFALPRLHPREREGALHVLGVVAMVLLGVALQGRFFAYHYAAALPLLALLAGIGLFKLTRLGERRALGVLLLVAALLGLANANGLRGRVEGSFLERVRALDDGRAYTREVRRAAAWVATHTAPDDPIFVWGFQPMLYGLADRRPASRFVYDAPLRAAWYGARARPRLLADLERDPPAAILVESGDVHPGTTGNDLDSRQALERFPRLQALLRAGYAPVASVGAFTIHLRRSDAALRRGPPSDRE